LPKKWSFGILGSLGTSNDPAEPAPPPEQKRGVGRPAETRTTLTVKVSAEDFVVLKAVEDETSLAPEETVRMLAHLAIWNTPEIMSDSLQRALEDGRKKARA
jgi:hypothetical protein